MSEDKRQLRTTFDQVALLYAQARPSYPAALFDDVATLASMPPGGRILEIGCGTGQATLPWASRGYHILAIELGANLAAVARYNLAAFPRLEVRVGAFEDWPVEAGAFDLVTSATAFHSASPSDNGRRLAAQRLDRADRPARSLALARY